jgi:hypothetical protein
MSAPLSAGQGVLAERQEVVLSERCDSSDESFWVSAPASTLSKGGGAVCDIDVSANPMTGAGSACVPAQSVDLVPLLDFTDIEDANHRPKRRAGLDIGQKPPLIRHRLMHSAPTPDQPESPLLLHAIKRDPWLKRCL